MKSDMKTTLKPFLNFNEKILITGSKGMLGWEFSKLCQKINQEVICTDIEELDITNEKKLKEFFEFNKPSIVINCAAYTAVDKAEEDRSLAYSINFLGPKLLARLCDINNIFLIHFSTDQVFDGKLGQPLSEEDETNPLNYYAETKLLGEKSVLEYNNSLVLRLQWLYGERKNRFSEVLTKKFFTPFSDQFGAPTWTKDVALIVFALLEKKAKGLFHFSYDDYASWAEVFEFIKEKLKLEIILEPKKTSEISLPAKRPLFSVLSNKKISSFLNLQIGSWKNSLSEFLEFIIKGRFF